MGLAIQWSIYRTSHLEGLIASNTLALTRLGETLGDPLPAPASTPLPDLGEGGTSNASAVRRAARAEHASLRAAFKEEVRAPFLELRKTLPIQESFCITIESCTR
jgi:hypothetical protein